MYNIYFKFKIYNTFFIVEVVDKRFDYAMKYIGEKFTIHDLVFDKRIKRMIKVGSKEYFIKKDNIYRFTISALKDTILYLKTQGVNKENINVQFIKPKGIVNVKYKWNKNFIPRDYQEAYVDVAKDKTISLIDLATGQGKMGSLDSKIKLRSGFIPLVNLKLGDEVLTQDGTYTKVTGIYEHFKKKLYKVYFRDGRYTKVGGEHLWKVFSWNWKSKREDGWRVVNTNFLIDKLKNAKSSNDLRYYVPLTEPDEGEYKDFIIDPYILGCLIGDGNMTNKTPNFNISDQGVIERMKTKLYPNYKINYIWLNYKNVYKGSITILNRKTESSNIYIEELKRYNLFGCTALTKFIPKDYLNASVEQRWELLRGLMDTDGYVSDPTKRKGRTGKPGKCGTLTYSTSSRMLKESILLLVRSLGGLASVYVKHPTFTYKGKKYRGQDSYVINMRFKNPRLAVTRQYRRLERLTETNQYSDNLKLRIERIEEIPGEYDCRCIKVEHPSSLYITDQYIVTHNSLISSKLMEIWNRRTAILVLPKYIEKWVDDVKKYFLLEDDDFLLIQGGDTIRKLSLIDKKKLDKEKFKIVIMSMTTITNYLTAYENDELEDGIVTPDNLMEHLGCGVLFNDESHQHFHALLRATLYFNVEKLLGSTATLDSNRRELKDMYNRLFTPDNRISNLVKKDRYINVLAVNWYIHNVFLKCRGPKGYSHVMFEQSMMRHNRVFKQFINMLTDHIDEYYIKHMTEDDDKLLIFAATVDMCTYITNLIKMKYPKLTVSRYVEQDDYENIMTSNITVSTLGSAGTALDIPKLITVINTVSVSSLQSNLQSVGRLRNIPNKKLWYIYFYSRNIQQQVKLHLDRKNVVKPTVLNWYEQTYGNRL